MKALIIKPVCTHGSGRNIRWFRSWRPEFVIFAISN
jgi:hypothetical protein